MAIWQFRHKAGQGVISLSGSWLAIGGELPTPELGRLCGDPKVGRLSLEVNGLDRWDTLLLDFLWDVKRAAAAAGVALDDGALPESVKRLLRLLPSHSAGRPAPAPLAPPYLARLGDKSIDLLAEVGASAMLAAAVSASFGRMLRGRARVRRADFVANLLDAGPRALSVVGIVNFLIGAVLAYIGAAQLRPFGAENYVPNLTALASVREITSVMTAIVMAGRTGGAYAARIASMKGNDEIAALQTTGIPLSDFFLLPAIVSLCLTMPILYLLGTFAAILGGLSVATVSLGFTAIGYLHETLSAVPVRDFIFGAAKSFSFAVLIGVTSCRTGLRAPRSAAAVGDAATRAVVTNIIWIIAFDALFAAIAGAWRL
jgi:phospholipid/cholesterol/gamma-HCH transport system permease protein